MRRKPDVTWLIAPILFVLFAFKADRDEEEAKRPLGFWGGLKAFIGTVFILMMIVLFNSLPVICAVEAYEGQWPDPRMLCCSFSIVAFWIYSLVKIVTWLMEPPKKMLQGRKSP